MAGFLPPKKNQRQKMLKDLSLEARTLVFYEAPHRLLETLADMEEILGQRKAAVVKEITKMYEEVLRGSIAEVHRLVSEKVIAGEYVIVVEGRREGEVSFEDALPEVWAMMKKGKGRKEAVTLVSK